MNDLIVRLRNVRKNGKPLDTCLEAANLIEQLANGLWKYGAHIGLNDKDWREPGCTIDPFAKPPQPCNCGLLELLSSVSKQRADSAPETAPKP